MIAGILSLALTPITAPISLAIQWWAPPLENCLTPAMLAALSD